MPEVIHVAAAALVDTDGRVLLAQRHADAHQGGLWEFPGGKCEVGETFESALHRELDEELGVKLLAHRPLIRIRHDYPDRSVVLDVHRVAHWQGQPQGREGQPIEWVPISNLAAWAMPAADRPIVHALQLPEQYLISPPGIDDSQLFLQQLEQALQHGLGMLQLRVFDLDEQTRLSLAIESRILCQKYAVPLLINADQSLARRAGISGLHLNSHQLQQLHTRPAEMRWVAASCHSPADLRKAQQLGVDFAVLSPVLPTRSHPDAAPLGWARFAEWVEAATIPVYALGGMQADLLPQAWMSGGQGIAGIRGLWPKTA